MSAWPAPRRRFTVDEYHRMAKAGILHEDDRIELLDGEIIEMAPIGDRHAMCVNDLSAWAFAGVAGRAIVSVQNPVRLSSGSEPQPDLALLRPRPDRYGKGLPGPGDVFLLIEVADTTLRYDRQRKLPRYAQAGIPELWIVDLPAERILVHRSPHQGRYQRTAVVRRGGTLAPEAFPDLVLRVEDLFT